MRPLARLRSLCLLVALALSIYASAAFGATLSLPTNSDYSAGGQYSSITVSGGNNVSISGSPLTITGPGGTAGMFNPRNGAITVNGTSLILGDASNPAGGTFAARVTLDGNGHLGINGTASSSSFSLGRNPILTTGNGAGTLTLQGTGSLVNVSSAGAKDAMLARIGMNGDIRLALRDGFWAVDTRLDGGSQITIQQGNLDLPAASLIYMNDGSRIWVQKGAATVGNVRLGSDLDAPLDWLYKNNVLESMGDMNILGQLVVDHGLGSVISHNGNIIFSSPQGEIEINGGQLHMEALNGKISAPGGSLPISGNITALEVEAAAINCKNLVAQHVIAHTLAVAENASISTFGITVDSAGIGGDLALANLRAASNLGQISVGGNVAMSAVGQVGFDGLTAGGNIAIDGGSLTGNALSGKNVNLGDTATSLTVKGFNINSRLEAGPNVTVRAGSLGTGTNPDTTLEAPESGGKTGIFVQRTALENASVVSRGQEIHIESGSLSHTSITAAAGDITAGQPCLADSALAAANDITLGLGTTFAGSGNFVGAARNLASQPPLAGEGLLLYAGNSLAAPELSAEHVAAAHADIAGNARATASFAAGEAKIGGNLELFGAPYAYGAFNNLEVAGNLAMRDATLAAGSASAKNISLSGIYPSEFNVISLAAGSSLNVGENGYASLGQLEGAWLMSNAPSSATHGALGIYTPVEVSSLAVGAPQKSSGIQFGPESFLLVNAPAALESAQPAGAISASSPVDAHIANGAKIAFSGDIRPNNVYVALGSNITTHYESAAAWDDSNIETGSHLISLKKIAGRDGSFLASSRPSSDVYPDLDGSLGGVVDDAINRPGGGGASAPPASPSPGIPALPHPTPGAPAVPAPGAGLPAHPPVAGLPDEAFPAIPAGPDYPETPAEAAPGEPADGSIGTGPGHLNSSLGGTRFLSRVTSTLYMDHDYRGAVKTLESSARMAILGAVPQMVYAANNSAADAARQRASFVDGAGLASVKAEDIAGHAFALWIMPLFKSVHGFDLHANNFGYDFNGNLGGLVAGADWTFSERLRAGFDVSMGGGYSESGGDLSKTTNNMGFFGAGLYGGWQIDQLNLTLDAHYTGSWNDLSQELPASMKMSDLNGDLTASALSSGLRAEYRLPLSSNWEILPHAGVRYAWIHVDKYTFYSDGAVLDGEAIDQQIWTFPLGMSLKGEFESESGWRFAALLDTQAIPVAGNVEARLKGRYIGTRPDFQIYTQTMDYFTAGGGLGIEAKKGDFSLGARVDIQAGLRGSTQSAFANFCYEF